MEETANRLPSAFVWRRLHSLTGFFLVLFLIEHLFVNSQAALFFGADGHGFIEAVNSIHNLPYLPIIELSLLAVPILIHAVWGVVYLRTSESNSYATDGSKPSLPEYPRNRAYTWQRITSWILLFGIAAHVIHMRFLEYPAAAQLGNQKYYMVRLEQDAGLDTVAHRLDVQLYDQQKIEELKKINPTVKPDMSSIKKQELEQEKEWIKAIDQHKLQSGEVVAVSSNFGTASLLLVRETFKMPLMMLLYSILVIAACFHAAQGFWTFMISWGVTLTERSQQLMGYFSTFLMGLLIFLGLASIWGTYWLNLYN
jgi:succinate dehydrogenase / fumarate reductase cytochrome b subunit